jgi:hypothetical protein
MPSYKPLTPHMSDIMRPPRINWTAVFGVLSLLVVFFGAGLLVGERKAQPQAPHASTDREHQAAVVLHLDFGKGRTDTVWFVDDEHAGEVCTPFAVIGAVCERSDVIATYIHQHGRREDVLLPGPVK